MSGMRVLVLAPKKLKSNWDLYRNNSSINPLLDDSFKYDVLCHTDINREKGMSGSIDLSTHRWDNYDLVVIDESHNFRNRNWKTDENATKTRYQHLMEKIIKSGRKTKVLLLSATPVNNSMHDIDNQIKFITNDKDNAFEEYCLKSISKICANAEKKSYEWSKYDVSTRTLENFEKLIGPEFKKLMDLISIARSRKQIVNNYKSNLIFPKRLDPINIKVNQLISKDLESSIKSIYDKIKIMTFGLYTPIKYIKPNVRDLYIEKYKKQNKDNFDQSDREKSLTKIMMTNWLKRYESSINSFMITLNKFYEKNKNLLSWLNNLGDNSFGYNSDDDFIDFDDEEDFDMIFSTKIPIRKQDIDVIKCKSDIMHDLDLIEEIRNLYKNINETNDDKLNELRKIIYSKISNPINENNKKIIIFSSYADTATYIYDSIQKELKDKGIYCALATGSYNKTNNDDVRTLDMNELLTYFSPKSKQLSNTKLKQNVNIDILIATDCISEGQNLQDCDYLINYDIHWNPVRIIQRYGRIDRIGSTNKKIQMVNFWPNIELEEYINLENIVHTKMSKVQHAGTADENILDNTFAEKSYRLKQLEELQNRVVDLEDLKGDVCISNLTFSEFTTDLQLYLENNSNKLINQPTGIFSIAKAEKIKSGVIFLFKNLSVSKTDNIIEPYYLIYVDMNGELILSYNDTTKILGLLKSISNSQNEINKDLMTKFNEKTEFGFRMDKYSIILDKAIEKINNKKDISKISSLFNKESEKNETQPEYELISFLIIGDTNV